MQDEIYASALFVLAGVWLFGAFHHGMLSRGRQVERSQQLFAVFCALMAGHLAVRAIGHHTLSYDALTGGWRAEVITAAMAFAVLPWFLVEFTNARPRWPRIALSLYVLIIALGVAGVPATGPLADGLAPWHAAEQPEAPLSAPTLLYTALLLGLVTAQLDGILACRRRYRSGTAGRHLAVGVALAVFTVGTLLELMRLLKLADTSPAFELSLLPALVLMSAAVGQDQRLNWMQALLDHVPAMITLKDRNRRYLLANKAFTDEYRLDTARLRGRTDRQLFPGQDLTTSHQADTDTFTKGDEVETEERVQSPDGIRFLRSRRFPVFDSNDHIWAYGCVSEDVTASRNADLEALELRQQLTHMERVTRLDAISASLAHELMQPLTATLSNAQAGLRLLEAHPLSMEPIREVLADIAADAKRASQIVRTLRDMTRHTPSPHEPDDLSEAVREVLDMLGAEMALKGVVCRRNLEPSCIATANKPQIQQVLLNLLLNAIHAVEQQPEGSRRVDVRAELDESGAVQVSVRDSGQGIPASEMHRLFTPFYSTKPEGMGIGLAVCRNIIEWQDGRIWAESNEPEPGTTFRFTLPAQESQFASQRAEGRGNRS
ncbi:PAS domain S-box-containing protein [Halomonas ventosae]|uniref:histidine kinase n=1 Tax=Halomonas ventosae TaxID=229007 RepID=A0A4R6ZL30_9GAMM|nr:ATP-binding protein [Halomonas ventosae]TDR53038.1 PAS domain S-box-containing protein [Halomonas ventosae]